MPRPMNSSRSLALDALARWRRGTEFSDRIVGEIFAGSALSSADRAFALELFYGVLRNLTLLDFWIAQLRSAPLDDGSRDLLRIGLYQILLIETAPHAAVFETVELTRPRARSLINAVLRRALREKAALTSAAAAQSLAVRYSTPEFLLEKWSRQFAAGGRERALPVEQSAGAGLCADQPAQNHGRGIPGALPGERAPPGKPQLCHPARSGCGAGGGRLLHPGSEHGAGLRNVAAGAREKPSSTPAPRLAARRLTSPR